MEGNEYNCEGRNELSDDFICNFLTCAISREELLETSNAIKESDRKRKAEGPVPHNLEQMEIDDDENDEIGGYDSDDGGGFNIDRYTNKTNVQFIPDPKKIRHSGRDDMVKIEVEPHIDPSHLVCKDSVKYRHLWEGSTKLPQSSNNFEFPRRGPKKPELTSKNEVYFRIENVLVNIDTITYTRAPFRSPECGVPDRPSCGHYSFLENSVIRGLPVKSPLYMYDLRIYRRCNADEDPKFWTLGGREVWWVDTCKLERYPLNSSNLGYFTNNCMNCSATEATRFKSAYLDKVDDNIRENFADTFGWGDYEEIIKDIIPSKGLHDKPLPELIRYIFCKELQLMSEFYKDIVLLNMHPRQLQALYKRITNDPFDLFFFKMTPFVFRITKVLRNMNKEKNGQGVTSASTDEGDGTDMVEGDDDQEQACEMELRQYLDQLTFNRDLVSKSYFNFDLELEIFWLYIPDINSKKLKKLDYMFTERQVATINIYQTIKDSYYNDFNLFENDWTLKAHISYLYDEDMEAEFESIMNWLCTTPLRDSKRRTKSSYRPTLIKEYRGTYMLNDSYLHMMIAVESFMLLFDRYADRESLDMDSTEKYDALESIMGLEANTIISTSVVKHFGKLESDIDITKLGSFCSEQLKAAIMFRDSPITLISGGGGSGKSTWIEQIAKSLPPDQIMLLSFQGRNASQHTSVFGPRALTIHNMLYMHKKCCVTDSWSTGNTFRRHQDPTLLNDFTKVREHNGMRFTRCMLEEIKYVFFEESSMITPELFGESMSVLSRCAKLERVVIIGDYRQCPAIGPGQLLKDFKKVCDELGVSVEFTHNHRTGSEVLHNNALAIANGDFESMIFDDISSIYEHFETDYSKDKSYAYGQKVVEVIKKYNIRQFESTILAHTNVIVDSINPVAEAHYLRLPCSEKNYHFIGHTYHRGSKAMFKMNFYLKGNTLINNETFKILGIEDFKPLPKKEQKGPDYFIRSLSDNKKVVPVQNTRENRSFSGCRRRLVVKDLDHITNSSSDSKKFVPFFGMYRNKLKKADATTIEGSQGGEHEDVIIFMPFKSKGWTNEKVYTAFTRGKKRTIFIGTLEALEFAINNRERERNSLMATAINKTLDTRVPGGWRKWKPMDKYSLYEELIYQEEYEKKVEEMSQPPTPHQVRYDTTLTDVMLKLVEYVGLIPFHMISEVYKLRGVCKAFRDAINSKYMWLGLYEILYRHTSLSYRHDMKEPKKLEDEFAGILSGNIYQMNRLATFVLNNIGLNITRCFTCRDGSIMSSASLLYATKVFLNDPTKTVPKRFDDNRPKFTGQFKTCDCGIKRVITIQMTNEIEIETCSGHISGLYPEHAYMMLSYADGTSDETMDGTSMIGLRRAHPREYRMLGKPEESFRRAFGWSPGPRTENLYREASEVIFDDDSQFGMEPSGSLDASDLY